MAINNMKGKNVGFSLSQRPIVCEIVRIDTNEKIGCQVLSNFNDSTMPTPSIAYILKPISQLQSSTIYEIRLTTQSYNQPEGIQYPS
jgi:hypothetical protein